MKILWNSEKPKLRKKRAGEPFRLGDEIPEGYFTEEELAKLKENGKVKIVKPQVVELGKDKPKKAEESKKAEEPKTTYKRGRKS